MSNKHIFRAQTLIHRCSSRLICVTFVITDAMIMLILRVIIGVRFRDLLSNFFLWIVIFFCSLIYLSLRIYLL